MRRAIGKGGPNRLRRSPFRVLLRVGAPAQAPDVEMPRIAEEVPQLHKQAVRHMAQTKDSDVLTPALRASGTQSVLVLGPCRSEPGDW
jgi:hypothetical protein